MDTLIFSASIGAGHDQVARALKEEILRRHPEARVSIVDTITYISPILNKLMLEGYLNMVRFTPRMWGRIYTRTEGDSTLDIGSLAYRLLARALTRVIKDYSPQAIICTHPFSAGLIATLKRKGRIHHHLTTVITDFTVHSYWIEEGVDLLCLAHEKLMYLVQELGVPEKKVATTGIPILSKFQEKMNKQEARNKHALKDLPTVLVMGGALGMGNITQVVKQLDQNCTDCQIIVVAGRNEILKNELLHYQWRNEFRVHGFVNFIHELMAASDLVLTKPGGVTSAEALSQGRPIVVISPIPGQEDRNSDFLTEQGAAIRLADERFAGVKISQLMTDAPRLQALSQMSERLAKPEAAAAVIDQIEQVVKSLPYA